MSEVYKLDDKYIDSTGIVHNNLFLSNILNTGIIYNQPANLGRENSCTPQVESKSYDWCYKFCYSIPTGNCIINGTKTEISNTVIVGFGYVMRSSKRQWMEIGYCLYSNNSSINGKILKRKDYAGGSSYSPEIGWTIIS